MASSAQELRTGLWPARGAVDFVESEFQIIILVIFAEDSRRW
jgi:hypothetical protein